MNTEEEEIIDAKILMNDVYDKLPNFYKYYIYSLNVNKDNFKEYTQIKNDFNMLLGDNLCHFQEKSIKDNICICKTLLSFINNIHPNYNF